MKYEVEATKETNRQIGDRKFIHAPGDREILSAAGVEIALSEDFGGAYRLVREIPESPGEIRRFKAAEEKQEREEKAREEKREDEQRARVSARRKALSKLNEDELRAAADKAGVLNREALSHKALVDAVLKIEFTAAAGGTS